MNLIPAAVLDDHLALPRKVMVRQIWVGASILALLDIPVIVWRIIEVGWHPQALIHLVLFMFTIAIALSRDKIKLHLLAPMLVGGAFITGIAGAASLGMMGAGFLWIAFGTCLVSLLYSLRVSIIVGIVSASIMIVVGISFVNGTFKVPFDLQAHMVSASGWLNFLVITTIVPFVMIFVISTFQQTISKLIAQLEGQRKQLEVLANVDALTGLPSARIAMDRLHVAMIDAKRLQEKVSLMFIDLDGFKAVNDTHGHAIGDEVLKMVSQRLVSVLREVDTVTRVGGDEFVVVLKHLSDPCDLEDVAKNIIAEINDPIKVRGSTVSVGASIGIALFPDHAVDMDNLRSLADSAMYKAKRSGKNQFCFAEHVECC
jgi:diguanylate cyclase (GGDEF)-like protein